MSYPQEQLSAQQLKEQLQSTGDFLHLTRSHGFFMPAFDFEVADENGLSTTKISVLNTGIIVFEPKGRLTSKDIVLSCAVHGNETAPIEICDELIQQLILGKLHLEHRVLFLLGNPASINISTQYWYYRF